MTVNNSSTLASFFGKSILGKDYENDLNMIYVNNIIKYLFTDHISNYKSKDQKSFQYTLKGSTVYIRPSLEILQGIFLVKCDCRFPIILQRVMKKYQSYELKDYETQDLQGYELHLLSVFLGIFYLHNKKDSFWTHVARFINFYGKKPDKNRIVTLLGDLTSSNIPHDIKIYSALLVYDILGADAALSWKTEVDLFFSDSKSRERDPVLYLAIEERARSLKLYK